MDKTTKNIINKTIRREYEHIGSDFAILTRNNKNKELVREHKEYSNKVEELSAKLKEILPEECEDLVEDLLNTSACITSIESEMFFKEGVCMGATEFSYLGEVGTMLNFI